MAGSVNAGLVSTDNSGINFGHYPRSRSTGTLTPELYRGNAGAVRGKLDGYTEHACREITLAEAPASLLDYSRTVRKMRGIRGGLAR